MKNRLRSLFKRTASPAEGPDAEPGPPAEAGPVSARKEGAGSDGSGSPGPEAVLEDLRACISACSSGGLAASEIDPRVHMYDAGYVDSITGADLLVHIEKRYGLYIHEGDLVGGLSDLDALVRHIVAKAS